MVIKTVTNKETREYDMPVSWETTSTGKFETMASEWDKEDLIKLFSILSGIGYTAINTSTDRDLEENLIRCTRFVFTDSDFKTAPVPEILTINGKDVQIPKNVGSLSIGQNIHVRQEIDRIVQLRGEKATYEELISYACAMYLQPLVDEMEFNYERAIALREKIKELPITVTYPIGFFLLSPMMKNGLHWRSVLNPLIAIFRDVGRLFQRHRVKKN